MFALSAAGYAQGSEPVIPWLRIVLAFAFCIALAVAAILWMRARQQGGQVDLNTLLARFASPAGAPARQALEVEHRLRVTATGQFLLLRCEQRRYLVHVGSQGAELIDRLEDAPPPPGPGEDEA